MREADQREVWASHRHTPEQALAASLDATDHELAWTCLVDGVPAFMWGAARRGSLLSMTGAPWLLGTPEMRTVWREFLRQCPAYVARMQAAFPLLENYVHAGNRTSIRWLRWCGFTVETQPSLFNGEMFYLFWRTHSRPGTISPPVSSGPGAERRRGDAQMCTVEGTPCLGNKPPSGLPPGVQREPTRPSAVERRPSSGKSSSQYRGPA